MTKNFVYLIVTDNTKEYKEKKEENKDDHIILYFPSYMAAIEHFITQNKLHACFMMHESCYASFLYSPHLLQHDYPLIVLNVPGKGQIYDWIDLETPTEKPCFVLSQQYARLFYQRFHLPIEKIPPIYKKRRIEDILIHESLGIYVCSEEEKSKIFQHIRDLRYESRHVEALTLINQLLLFPFLTGYDEIRAFDLWDELSIVGCYVDKKEGIKGFERMLALAQSPDTLSLITQRLMKSHEKRLLDNASFYQDFDTTLCQRIKEIINRPIYLIDCLLQDDEKVKCEGEALSSSDSVTP